MKRNRGFVKRSTRIGLRPVFHILATLLLAGLAVALISCGEISLNRLLENEDPGELGISPKDAMLPSGGTLDIQGSGGFKPYTFEDKSTAPQGTLNTTTGEYVAPASIPGNTKLMEVEVTDYFGRKAISSFTVYAPLSMSPVSKTIETGNPVNFSVSGGVGPYDYIVDGVEEATDIGSNWNRVFASDGVFVVQVIDSNGNGAASTITAVVPDPTPTGDLEIDLPQRWVELSTSISVSVINSAGSHVFSTVPAGVGIFDDPAAVSTNYNAPNFETTLDIKVTEGARSATVEIHVVGSAPPPLSFPSQATVETDDEDVTLTVSGGVPPYTYWLVGEGSLRDHPVHNHKIKYEPPSFVPAEKPQVWVEDAVGQRKFATITVEDD